MVGMVGIRSLTKGQDMKSNMGLAVIIEAHGFLGKFCILLSFVVTSCKISFMVTILLLRRLSTC